VSGTLHLVSTPIGNLSDVSARAVEVLGRADLICCEDTRHSGRLLQHLGIESGRLAVCNEHTERDLVEEVVDLLASGHSVALISDAGTPALSDPGGRLAAAVADSGHRVEAVPGASALLAALVVSGLDTSRFAFEGFLPRSGRDREERLAEVAASAVTVVLYEAPHRLERTLDDLREVCGGERRVSVSRELTKMHEETVRGSLGSIDIGSPRGEYVIVLEGRPADDTPVDESMVRDLLERELADGATRRDAATTVARRLGVPRRTAYDLVIAMAKDSGTDDGGTR
jgi:16S rRNA (cytidine1402-2'-O)-methyltransferase